MIEDVGLVLKGVVLGLAIAAPIGPIGLLCIRRTVQRGILAGVATGFGAALVDTLFSAIAAFGITTITDVILGHELMLRVVGGIFLVATAVHGLTHAPRTSPKAAAAPEASSLARAVATGFVITITNPITIVAILAVVAGFGGALRPPHATALVAGIFAGSTLWWVLLAGMVWLLSRRMGDRMVGHFNRGTAVALGLLGLWALGSAAMGYSGLMAAAAH